MRNITDYKTLLLLVASLLITTLLRRVPLRLSRL